MSIRTLFNRTSTSQTRTVQPAFARQRRRSASTCVAALAMLAGTMVAMTACTIEAEGPNGKITASLTPKPVGEDTTLPIDKPDQIFRDPRDNRKDIYGYDTDDDGHIDLVYDPQKKQYYDATPRPRGGSSSSNNLQSPPLIFTAASNPIRTRQVRSSATAPALDNSLGVNSASTDFQIQGCLIDDAPLPWGAASPEQWLQDHGLNVPAGTSITGESAVVHSFDTEGDADVTIFWSTAFAVPRPATFGLCYALHALPSATPGQPWGVQIRVRGPARDVSRYIATLGVTHVELQQDGLPWTVDIADELTGAIVSLDGVPISYWPFN